MYIFLLQGKMHCKALAKCEYGPNNPKISEDPDPEQTSGCVTWRSRWWPCLCAGLEMK